MTLRIEDILATSGRPARAEADWVVFEKAYYGHFKKAVPTGDDHPLAWLFGRSLFLTARLISDPSMADRFFKSAFLKRPKVKEDFASELRDLVGQSGADQVGRALRRYRYEEDLRIAVRELAGLASFIETGKERSDLASALIEVASLVLLDDLCGRHGLPQDSSDGVILGQSRFTVLGMGKLGGEDLNFSSDVDLVYLYSSDEGGFSKKETEMTHHEFYTKLCERLSRTISDKTEDGFVYRVDLSLRPEGKKGTLVNSIRAMETYYESFGDNWERMAMIKARPIAGSLALGDEFCSRIRPFVYPRASDFSVFSQMKDLKSRIERSLQDRLESGNDPEGEVYNVKLGSGGIREVEFFVGAFQRLYGGKDISLQTRNTLAVISGLVSSGLISRTEGLQLDGAYRFLREVENRLQMVEEMQTHSIPKDSDAKRALACDMIPGKDPDVAVDIFRNELLLHTTNVRTLFNGLFNK